MVYLFSLKNSFLHHKGPQAPWYNRSTSSVPVLLPLPNFPLNSSSCQSKSFRQLFILKSHFSKERESGTAAHTNSSVLANEMLNSGRRPLEIGRNGALWGGGKTAMIKISCCLCCLLLQGEPTHNWIIPCSHGTWTVLPRQALYSVFLWRHQISTEAGQINVFSPYGTNLDQLMERGLPISGRAGPSSSCA